MGKAMTGTLLAALLAPAVAWAQARVEAVQYPAWLERGGYRVPLAPGTSLQSNDTLRTGGNARVQLDLGEGSVVKVGENAQFVVERVQPGPSLRAALSVIAGAFRFTSQAAARRNVSIKVRHVTVGIRGTDLWGKSTDERDLVCLIEGNVAVSTEGHPSVSLDQPLDFYQRPRGGTPQVAKVDPQQLQEWAKETEIAKDAGAARAGGPWRVVAATFDGRDSALAFNRTLRAAGYPSEVVTIESKFVAQVRGLATEADARALMANLRNFPGVGLPHVRDR